VGIATAAWAGALVVRRWLLQVNGIADERRLPPSVAAASAGVAASCWGLLFWNNLPSLCRVLGFDSSAHLDYVQFILDRGELPLAHQGWEMYQPPLYYLIAAAGLKLCGLATHHDSGVMLLRTLNACSGVVQFVLIFASLRLLFPEHPRRQIAGLVLAAFLPLHLYLPHYVTNEALAGVLATASIYLALRCLRQSEPALGVYVGVGLCLGAALLTKFTALVVVPIVLSVLLGQQIIARRFQLRVAVRTVGVTLLVCALASGWHYARVWWHYGKPIVGNWDQASGFRWWQDWGYATAGYYTGFGRSLVDPFFSGLDSLADGIYSTLWGDGLCGGTGGLEFRPPWNYGLVAVGYWLALLPTLCIVVGLARVLIEIVWRPRAEWFLLAGLAGSVGLALVYGSLRLPSFAMAKAFYGLPGMIALGVFGSWGFDLLATRLRRLRPVLWIGLGTWAINSYCSYWIPGNSAETHTMLAHALVLEGRPGQALEHYDAALRVDSRSVNARWGRATALMHLRRDADAVREFEQVLVEAPEHAPARVGLATVLFRGNQLDDAIRQVQQAISSMPNHRSAHFVLAQLLARTGQTGPAIDACREALRVTPGNRQIHRALAELYTQAGDDSAAAEHEQ
jgi:Flp pilus assembly protein TadD